MLLFSAILIILIILVIWFYFKNKTSKKYLKNIPGPPTNFLFGNTLDFLFKGYDKFLEQLIVYVNTYGKIIKVKSGPTKIGILITDPKFMEYILTSTKLIDKARDYTYFHNWLGMGIVTSTGAKWKSRRRMLMPTFHISILEKYINIFEEVSNILVNKLEEHIGSKGVDIYPLVTLATLDVICEAIMGTSVNAQFDTESKYVKSVKLLCQLVIRRTFSPIHDSLYFLRPVCYQEKAALKIVHDYTDAVIDSRIKELEAKRDKNVFQENEENVNDSGIKRRLAFLDLLLQCTYEDGSTMTRQELREEVDTFMFAGHDTTSSAITFILYSLANNPEIQKKVIDEQKSIFGNDKNPSISIRELNDMKYLELVIKETLRLYPSVPFYARELLEDLEYEGNLYPKDASLLLFVFQMQRNPEYFPEPDKFIPERFEGKSDRDPFVYLPFSAGPRNCIGQKFAMLEMKTVVSKVVRNFELFPATPKRELKLAPESILISKNGVWIAFGKRMD